MENIVQFLRVRAKMSRLDNRYLFSKAADMMENQQREIDALRQICEKQARLNRTVAVLTLELDKVTAERDALMAKLEGNNG